MAKPKTLRNLYLPEVMDFLPEDGIIRLHDQRVVILSSAALGLLRKELIETLGLEAARCLYLRFGYADGYHDAINLRDHFGWTDQNEALHAGPQLYTLEGLVRAEATRIEWTPGHEHFEAELVCERSYVAEEHVRHFGRSTTPMCWSLAGYMSGYASACIGRAVYFRELKCTAQGDDRCLVVGRDEAAWGADLEGLRRDFKGEALTAEVERVRVDVHREREALAERERRVAIREREIDILRERIDRHAKAKRFVLVSKGMKEVLELAGRVAPLDMTVLIEGESGTGKEFVARMIHEQSRRASGAFVSVNCAALTDTLLESELFGHVRGAFTGAVRDKPGLFEAANHGTLFLDEVGEMALGLQAKLLRALQEGEVRRVGSEKNVRVNPRVVAATNRHLRDDVAEGRFREDLYFRLQAFTLAIPPLRERREAIPDLVQTFLQRAASRFKRATPVISPGAMKRLLDYNWPGNIRELQNTVERALIVTVGKRLTVRELPPELRRGNDRTPVPGSDLDLRKNEEAFIREALARTRGHRKRAAAALNISPVTLWRKMKRYGLDEGGDADDSV